MSMNQITDLASSPLAGSAEPTTGRSVADLLRVQARLRPDAVVITGDGRPATYGQLDERSNRVADALVAMGVVHGDRVAYLDRNATEYWEVFFGAAKIGAAVSPVNFRLAGAELLTVLDDAEPRVLVIGSAFLPALEGGLPDGLPVVVVEDPAAGAVAGREAGAGSTEGTGPAGWREYEEWIATAQPIDPGGGASGDDLAVLMYSSGTTGRPKGVRTTADNLLWGIDNFVAEFAPDEDAVSLVAPPYYHVAAGGWALIVMSTGGRIIQVREPTPARLMDLMQTHRATHAALVPAIIQIMVSTPEGLAADWSSLHHVVYGGSAISAQLIARATEVIGAELTQSYGLTETVGIATLLRPEDHLSPDPRRYRSAGRAASGVDVAIFDPETGQPVGPGEFGEIVVRGPNVTPGYWRRPAETEALFWPGGWMRTGDGGIIDDAGYVTIVDRIKDLIVSGGENVASSEVEQTLQGHPDVVEVAVVAAPSERWGETPHAYVARRPGSEVTEEELLAFCRQHLAGYKCPTALSWITELPRNASGKVLKKDLRAPLWADQPRPVG
jgi:long-chain acyl-CoA synthetase